MSGHVQSNAEYITVGDDREKKGSGSWPSTAKLVVTVLTLAVIGLLIGVIVVSQKSSSSDSNSPAAPTSKPQPPPTSAPTSSPSSSLISVNLTQQILSMRNASLNPCDDFYSYACGGWFTANPTSKLLNATDSYFYSFSSIGNTVLKQQIDILQQHFPFLTTFYDECKDTASIDARGTVDIDALFTTIDSTGTANDFAKFVGQQQVNGVALTALFNIVVQPDNLYADVYRAYLQPSGLSAPTSFYAQPFFLQNFTNIIAQAFKAVPSSFPSAASAASAAADVVSIEARIFAIQLSLPPLFDQGSLIANTQRLSTAQLNTATRGVIDFAQYIQPQSASPSNQIDLVDVVTLDYFKQITTLIANFTAPNGGNINALRNYLKWHVLFGNLAYLPAPFRSIASTLTAAGFPTALFGSTSRVGTMTKRQTRQSPSSSSSSADQTKTTMNVQTFGVPDYNHPLLNDDATARDAFCVQATISEFSDLVSHEWVLKDFTDAQQEQATTLVNAIYAKIGERIRSVDWLDNATRVNAIDKWNKIVRNVGYSTDWLDYSTLVLKRSLFADVGQVSAFMTQANNALYQQPVDRTQMPTRDYMIQNAFYNPSTNNINLLGGLIFPPFFDTTAPMMLNYAAYGMVIGHEITHGFDNDGRLFNGTGAYVNWWTNQSVAEFSSRTQCLVDQYSSFSVDGGKHFVNGAQTLGENIADHGGINTAYDAYRAYAQPPSQLINGITNDQLFFLYYAQNWCAETTMAFALNRLVTDVHSPARFRVNGPLSNKPEFAAAYQCKPTDNMGRSLTPKKCALW